MGNFKQNTINYSDIKEIIMFDPTLNQFITDYQNHTCMFYTPDGKLLNKVVKSLCVGNSDQRVPVAGSGGYRYSRPCRGFIIFEVSSSRITSEIYASIIKIINKDTKGV